jgi:hypothetical protein
VKEKDKPVEDLGQKDWEMLVAIESALVGEKPWFPSNTHTDDLCAAGLITLDPDPKITERGWLLVAQIRRWKADFGERPFPVRSCTSCARLRYGTDAIDQRCVCKGIVQCDA